MKIENEKKRREAMKCMSCRYIIKVENDVKRNDNLYVKMKNEIVEMMFYIFG